MSSKTKIVVLHLKELIYTGIFALLGILFIVLLIIMFVPKDKSEKTGGAVETPAPSYVPGIYTTSLVLNDNTVDVAVTVDETNINDIRIVNLDEAVATMFPLLEPSLKRQDLHAVPSAGAFLRRAGQSDSEKPVSG